MGRAGDFGGGASDLVRVPFADAMLVTLPAEAEPIDWIGFADMAQDAYRSVGPQLLERPGARVLVIGGLPAVIGIYAAGLAVACGAGAVDFYDDDPIRLGEAARFGATPLLRGKDEPEGLYEIVVDSTIRPQGLIEAFRFAEPEALITSVGIHFGDTAAAPFMEAYHKGVTYRTGRPNCRQHMDTVHALCCSGAFSPQLLKPEVFDFDEAPEAWAHDALRTACVRQP
jgi:alcohol dehydrogenase